MDMVELFGPLAAKYGIREFQTENPDCYTEDGRLSDEYLDYLNWIQGETEFNIIAQELRDNFDIGLTPANYALPYVDKNKLQKYADDYLKKQLEYLKMDEKINSLIDIEIEVTNINREWKQMSYLTDIWGHNSEFYSNTLGHTMIYDYSKYICYTIDFKVTGTMQAVNMTNYDFRMLKVPYEHEFRMNYELIN